MAELSDRVVALEERNAALAEQHRLLLARIAELERRWGANPRHCHRPPSREG